MYLLNFSRRLLSSHSLCWLMLNNLSNLFIRHLVSSVRPSELSHGHLLLVCGILLELGLRLLNINVQDITYHSEELN